MDLLKVDALVHSEVLALHPVLCEREAQDSPDEFVYGRAQHRHYLPLSATLFEMPPAMPLPVHS